MARARVLARRAQSRVGVAQRVARCARGQFERDVLDGVLEEVLFPQHPLRDACAAATCLEEHLAQKEVLGAADDLGEQPVRRPVRSAPMAVHEAHVDHREDARTLGAASLMIEADEEVAVREPAVEQRVRVGAQGDVSVERHAAVAEAHGPRQVVPPLPPQMVHVAGTDAPALQRAVYGGVEALPEP